MGGNNNLTTLGNFTNLQSIGGYFYVGDNNNLTTLGNFTNLQSIGGYFRVSRNSELITLGDFPALTSIGIERVYVSSLTESRDSVSIVVEYNTNLVLCSWVEDLLPTETHAVIGGIYINNNASGCNSTEEINNPPPILVAKNRIFAHTDSTTTSFNVYSNIRWQLATSDDATWITSLSSGSNTHSSRITGENEATITLIHTRAPSETPRNTTLTLTAVDEEGEELTNPATMTIHFTQLKVYEGSITLSSQEEVDEFISNTTVIDGNLTIGYASGSLLSDITDLSPLRNIVRITGDLIIQYNGQLVNLNGLDSLQSIGGNLSVQSHAKLTTLGDFPVLQSIGGYFWVVNNDTLTTLGDFPELQTIGGLFNVRDNSELTDLGDFPALQTIGGLFNVRDNSDLTDLGDFPDLQTIGGYFRVLGNSKLTNLGDFPGLQTIGGYFGVSNNSELTDLGDFLVLQTIGEYFRVSGNSELTDLGDFPALQTIGEYFRVSGNSELTDLGDFPALQTIGGYFAVLINPDLTTLGDFPDLQSIGGFFYVTNNDTLTTLGNFPALTSIGTGTVPVPSVDGNVDNVSIVVERNSNLLLCSWVENFLPDGIHAVRGDIYIQNNATGCETTEEIKNPVLVAKDHIFVHTDSTTTSFNIYASVRWKLVTSDDATWITSLSSGSNTHSSRITGENEATITLIHTRAPSETPRNTTLTLTAIDEEGNELTNPASVTIHFTQLKVYEGSITLSSQEEVDEFISNTTVIDGNLTIGYTSGNSRSDITDLTPLGNVVRITGDLIIQQNGQLVNLNGLDSLQSIGGYFGVSNNSELTDLGDFPTLQTIGKSFQVDVNSELTDLGDFPALQTIGGYFAVFINPDLTTLGYFPDLQSIGGFFYVTNNDTLTTLGNFPALTSIGTGTVPVPSVGGNVDNVSIVVEDNSSLSDCHTLTDFLSGGVHAVSGGHIY